MNYRVRIGSSIRRRIVAWKMPDTVFVEILLRLEQDLGRAPHALLTRTREPFDGMTFGFSMVDPENRFRVFYFAIHVYYHADEQTLVVANCFHRSFGL